MRISVVQWSVALVVLLVMLACAPKSAPQVATPVSQPAPAATAVAGASPEDAAWAKVVAAAKREGTVTIYGGGQFAGDTGRKTMEAFSSEYGIRIDLLLMAGRQAVERIKIESKMKQPIGDIAGMGVNSVTELSLAGLLDSIWKELPELRNRAVFKIDPLYSPNGDVLNMSFSSAGILINTKWVKAQDEPKSFFDLLDPKWKGKMIIGDPRGGGGGGFAWFSIMRYYKVLDDDYFRRFARQEPMLWGGSTIEEASMVARGEKWLDPFIMYANVGPLILEGAPLKLLSMTEGSYVSNDDIGMVKGAPHPNAAKLFINWLFSREGQNVFAKAAASVDSMRKDVPDYVDSRVKPQPEPQRYLIRTYEVAEIANQYQKEGIAESIFGNK